MNAARRPNQYDLLGERRFAPFFWTQFLGAANDNVYKNALILFVAFQAADLTTLDPNALVNVAGAIFIAPFVLLSATAGQLADKYEKSRLIRLVKLFEIAIMAVGLVGFWQRDLTVLLVALAMMGVHSTVFGPVKYAILPQVLARDELIGGNGMVEMGTFVAILLGTIGGGLLIAIPVHGPVLASIATLVVALAGYLASRRIPYTPPAAPDLVLNWNPFAETWRNLRLARRDRVVWRSMLGVSWFWFYGATFLAQFAGYSRDVLGGDEHVVTFLLAVFSIGIGTGSLLCERLSARRVELGLVPLGAIGMSVFAVDLWLASRDLHASALAGLGPFLALPAHWRVALDLALIGLFGGFYIVPLYALLQERSEPSHRSRIIAANNIMNALLMVASAGVAVGLLALGLSIPEVFLATAVLNAVVAMIIFVMVPEFLLRFVAWILVHLVYRVEKRGLEHVPERGACIVVCNHVSYVDAVVIAACVRRPIRFLMDHRVFRTPGLSFLFRTMRAIPIAPARDDPALKQRALDEAAQALADGEIVGLFPEGKLTDTGELDAFRPGVTHLLAQHAAPVVPLALSGMWGSLFSRARGRALRGMHGLFSRIGIAAGPPVAPHDVTLDGLRATVLALRGVRR